MDGPTVLFDDACAMCARSVRFVLAHERDHVLRFAGRSSEAAAALRASFGVPDDLESMVLIEDGRVLTHSDAVLGIAAHLRAPWRWARIGRFVPRALRDRVYRMIARRRQRWSGGHDACLVPGPEVRARFLD
ncbi:MAG: DUF393 domain-containing protein [Phycisphaerales bacterium]|nr:DUF393 domain-containing protein [Phycisphaerales bacterium]